MATAEIGALRVTLALNAGEFSRALDRAEKDVSKFGDGMGALGDKLMRIGSQMTAAISGPLAAIGALSAKTAMTFEKNMANISTIVDTTAESMSDMSARVLELAKTVPQSANELSKALYDIRSAGVSAADQFTVLKRSAELAVAALGTTQEAADIATSAINAFGLQGAEVERMFSNLFTTTQFGKTTVSQLAQGFGQVAGTVANAGVKLDEFMAITAALTTTGLSASEAYTQVRAAIDGLINDSEIASKVFKTLGAENFKELIAESGGLVGAFERIHATLQGNDIAIKKLFGSVEAYNAIIALTGNQNAVFRQSLEAMRSGVDGLGEAFAKQATTSAAKWALLQNSLERIAIHVGGMLLPALQQIATWVENVANAFSTLSPEMQKAIVILAALAAAVGPLVVVFGGLVTALGAIIPVIAGVGATILGFIATSGPIGLMIVGVTTLSAAWHLWGNDLIALVGRVVSYVSAQFNALITKIGQLKGALTSLMSGDFSGAAAQVAEVFNGTVTPAVQGTADAFKDVEMQSNLASVAITAEAAALTAATPITNLATESKKALGGATREYNAALAEGKALTEQMMTPLEALIEREHRLLELFGAGAISARTFGRAMAEASAFSARNMDALASNVSSNLGTIFGQTKAVAIATALINTYQGVTKALATYPPPIAQAMAGLQLAAGMAAVANIRSQQKSGGGGGGSSGGGGGGMAVASSAASTAAAAPSAAQTLNIVGIDPGHLYSGEAVRGLAAELIRFQADGGKIVLQ